MWRQPDTYVETHPSKVRIPDLGAQRKNAGGGGSTRGRADTRGVRLPMGRALPRRQRDKARPRRRNAAPAMATNEEIVSFLARILREKENGGGAGACEEGKRRGETCARASPLASRDRGLGADWEKAGKCACGSRGAHGGTGTARHAPADLARGFAQLATEVHARQDVNEELMLEMMMLLHTIASGKDAGAGSSTPGHGSEQQRASEKVGGEDRGGEDRGGEELAVLLAQELDRISEERDAAEKSAEKHRAWSRRLEAELDLVLRDRFDLEHGLSRGAGGGKGSRAPPSPVSKDDVQAAREEIAVLRAELASARESERRSEESARAREAELAGLLSSLNGEISALRKEHRSEAERLRDQLESQRREFANSARHGDRAESPRVATAPPTRRFRGPRAEGTERGVLAVPDVDAHATQTPPPARDDGAARSPAVTKADIDKLAALISEQSLSRASLSPPKPASSPAERTAPSPPTQPAQPQIDSERLEQSVADAARSAVLESHTSLQAEHNSQIKRMAAELDIAKKRGDIELAAAITEWMRRFASVEHLAKVLLEEGDRMPFQ